MLLTHNKVVSLSIPAEAEYIDIVRYTLYGIAASMGFHYEAIEDMKVAVSEAVNNAIIHAYDHSHPHKIDIAFDRFDRGLKIHVKDWGVSFDVNRVNQNIAPLFDMELQDVKVGGLGIYLMQALMDEVDVQSDNGTEVTLTKFL